MTRTRGAPCKPSDSTSQPASASTWWRAAASAVKFAIIPPVTKPTDALGREAEQVDDPAGRRLLDHRRRGRGDVEARVVVPAAREPVGGERGRVAPADDEAEVARAGNADEAGPRRGRRAARSPRRSSEPASGTGPPNAARSSSSVAVACTGSVSKAARCAATSSPTSSEELVERSVTGCAYVSRRRFSSKIASIGPGSTSLSRAR